MTSDSFAADALRELSEIARKVADDLEDELEAVSKLVSGTLAAGGRLFFCGNGGSAAEAQHLAAEYVVRFGRDRAAFPAVALTTDTSVLTAAGNDVGFHAVFSRQVEALARQGDLLFLLSTSGESENLLRAAAVARGAGVTTVAFLARGGGRLAGVVDRGLVVPTASTPRAQEVHLAMGHIVCGRVEEELSRKETDADSPPR